MHLSIDRYNDHNFEWNDLKKQIIPFMIQIFQASPPSNLDKPIIRPKKYTERSTVH